MKDGEETARCTTARQEIQRGRAPVHPTSLKLTLPLYGLWPLRMTQVLLIGLTPTHPKEVRPNRAGSTCYSKEPNPLRCWREQRKHPWSYLGTDRNTRPNKAAFCGDGEKEVFRKKNRIHSFTERAGDKTRMERSLEGRVWHSTGTFTLIHDERLKTAFQESHVHALKNKWF